MSPRRGRPIRGQRRSAAAIAATAVAIAVAGGGIASGNGGFTVPDPPAPTDVRCIERCLGVRVATETGVAEITGKDLGAVTGVKLRGTDGAIQVSPTKTSSSRVVIRVPVGATSGKPTVVDESGNKVRSPVELKVRPKEALEEVAGFELRSADATSRKSFFNGRKPAQVDYLFEAEEETDIRIDVLKGKRGRLVDSIIKRDQEPFANNSVVWKGLTDEGRVAPNGSYRFEVSQLAGGAGERSRFRHYDHKFPLPARHGYGDGLGAGRGHQGQDVFARCGAPIYAARGGRVQVRASHSAAGHYVVIDGKKTGVDYVYMHLEQRGRPKEGSRVKTGDLIGYNSDTGRASGCHLHFEMWSAPGWYEGGRPLNPTKRLRRWDRWS